MQFINKVNYLLNKENTKTVYLSIFRIYIALHIIKKLLFYLPYLNLIYGKDSFVVSRSEDVYGFLNLDFFRDHNFLLVYSVLVLSILFLFGIGKHLTCIFLYILVEILQRMNYYPLNGGDNLLKFVLLYLCFCNCYSYFCIKNKDEVSPLSNFMTNLGVFSIVFHLCIIYFVSAIHKIHSDVWFNGVASYYALSIERFSGTSINSVLTKNGMFVTITTYLTLAFELSFPFLVFNKNFKHIVLISGILLHISIYIFMMIHDFQILYISIYGLFYNNSDFFKLNNYIKSKTYYAKIIR
jgi:hypothetical protein